MPRVFVVLPAYNEQDGLPPLLERIRSVMSDLQLDYQVIVIDDGSADRTSAVAEEWQARIPLHLFRHDVNQGLGPTLRQGLLAAVRQGDPEDVAVVMDADNTHPPEALPSMLEQIRCGCDVVIASRFRRGSRVVGVSWARRLYSRVAAFLFQLFFPIEGVRDYTCGYRAYRVDVLRRAVDRFGGKFVDQAGFQCMVDTLLKLRTLGLTFCEVPFELRYDYKAGETKMEVGRTIRATMSLLVKRRFQRR